MNPLNVYIEFLGKWVRLKVERIANFFIQVYVFFTTIGLDMFQCEIWGIERAKRRKNEADVTSQWHDEEPGGDHVDSVGAHIRYAIDYFIKKCFFFNFQLKKISLICFILQRNIQIPSYVLKIQLLGWKFMDFPKNVFFSEKLIFVVN